MTVPHSVSEKAKWHVSDRSLKSASTGKRATSAKASAAALVGAGNRAYVVGMLRIEEYLFKTKCLHAA
jgi:hypothetical protein